ncbi:NACHT domain-containing protein [Spirulina sp. CCNP1310]|uniref:WD40 domain-containing protein n=1 Tax=Spirulina sp. CCNP1310 TaxID=3110249 RepID=UPI002B1E9BD3|nr:NACHT domain-containing protein [Spirulina sp. CCNP1310]MEA5420511.1 NACHT domain-containing protein [Spirulina sp. CCNP1310]
MAFAEPMTAANQRSLLALGRAMVLAQEEFNLILVRCNYQDLRLQMVADLRAWFAETEGVRLRSPQGESAGFATGGMEPWYALPLPPEAVDLFQILRQAYREHRPPALMVWGFEGVVDLKALVEGANQVRDEFRRDLPVPIVLWMSDRSLQTLTRLAPDFKSWAAMSIHFELSLREAIAFWWEATEHLFKNLLEAGAATFLPNVALGLAPGCRLRQELEAAQQSVHSTPVSAATWQFILGRDAYAAGDWGGAIAHYQQSLEVWSQGQGYWSPKAAPIAPPPTRTLSNPFLDQKGLLLFHLALCTNAQAAQNPAQAEEYWQATRNYLAASWEIFTLRSREEFAAQLLIHWGHVLWQQQDWASLQSLINYSETLSLIQTTPLYRSQIYGFHGHIAQAKGEPERAIAQGQRALLLLADDAVGKSREQREVRKGDLNPQSSILNPPIVNPLIRAWLAAMVAQSQWTAQGEAIAIATLEQARGELIAQWSLAPSMIGLQREAVHIQILQQLRSLHRHQRQYKRAFNLKQEQHLLEQVSGRRAFHGVIPTPLTPDLPQYAPELVAGREVAIAQWIERLSRNDCKLTVLHGASGVGKTSLLRHLIPQLAHQIIGAREVVPVLQTQYRPWDQHLYAALEMAMPLEHPVVDPQSFLEHLRWNGEHRLLTVLIFDQFEDFFFFCADGSAQQQFYQLLRDLLRLPFVKVVLSLREDYLHYLLAIERSVDLDAIDHNILSRQVRYPLRDLTPAEAEEVIIQLTRRSRSVSAGESQFPMAANLRAAFIADLAAKGGTVRPLELHLLGAQLQADQITTLAQYRQLGESPKTALVGRSLATIIADCGPENENAVWQVLFTLTLDNNTRPLKTESELCHFLQEAKPQSGKAELTLILEILVGSRLLFRFPEDPEDRYQLVHDYLVPTIRAQYRDRLQRAIAAERDKHHHQLLNLTRQRWQAWLIGGVMTILATLLAVGTWQINRQRQQAEAALNNAELLTLSTTAEAQLASGMGFNALLTALQAAHHLAALRQNADPLPYATMPPVEAPVQLRVITSLDRVIHQVQERNQLQGHSDVVWDVVYSPDGQFLASGGRDRTVKIWLPNGQLHHTLTGPTDSITSLALQRTGANRYRLIASSWDGRVYQWELQKTAQGFRSSLRRQWQASPSQLYSLSLDQNRLATAASDGRVTLWDLGEQGSEARPESNRDLTPQPILNLFHGDAVRWVALSPTGEEVLAVDRQGQISLWDVQGALIRRWQGHEKAASYGVFSPDGAMIATASDDHTVKLWDRAGNLLKTLEGHSSWVFAVQFSPDSRTLATASNDQTVKLWDLAPTPEAIQLRQTLPGHRDGVTSLRFSPDGRTLATSSYDTTIRLWQVEPLVRPRLRDDLSTGGIQAVALAADGRVAAAGADGITRLWNRQGKLVHRLIGHGDAVTALAFSPDGEILATGSWDQRVRLWDRWGESLGVLGGHGDRLTALAWHPTGQWFASTGRDGTLRLWTASGQALTPFHDAAERLNTVDFSPDGRWLAAGSDDHHIYLWPWTAMLKAKADSLITPQILKGHENWVLAVRFLPQVLGHRPSPHNPHSGLISTDYSNQIRLWNGQGEGIKTVTSPTDSITHLSLSPHGDLFAATTWDHRLQLWSRDGELLQEWEGDQGQLMGVVWDRDGSRIATAGADGSVVLWSVDLDDLIGQGCHWLADYLRYNPTARTQSAVKINGQSQTLCR